MRSDGLRLFPHCSEFYQRERPLVFPYSFLQKQGRACVKKSDDVKNNSDREKKNYPQQGKNKIEKTCHTVYFILKLSKTFTGCQFNSFFAFSFENVRDSVIFFNFKELRGALFPNKSPAKAIDLANQ